VIKIQTVAMAACCVLAYVSGSLLVFSLAHPELTQAQVLLSAVAALTWCW